MSELTGSAEQARIAEEAGACAVMALERVPADIRQQGGVARMSDPKMIKEIMDAVSIPVMAKVRIGHFVEAQVWVPSKMVADSRFLRL
jgi:pyridoxal 5'-phosphate synthase pdxS subunit